MPRSELVQSVTRSMKILELVAHSNNGMTLKDISQAVDVKYPTAHNLLRTLCATGFVYKDTNNSTYKVGSKFFELAKTYLDNDMMTSSKRVLSELYSKYPSSVITLSQIYSNEILIRLRISPQRSGLIENPLGILMPPYSGPTALLFQAYMDQEQLSDYRKRYPFAEFNRGWWKDSDDLDKYLESIRETGLADHYDPEQEIYFIAQAVFDRANHVFGVLGLKLPLPLDQQDRIETCKTDFIQAATRYVLSLEVKFIDC